MPPHCHLPQGGPAGPGPLQATAQSIAFDIRHLHVPRPTAPVTMVHSSLQQPLRLKARGARTQQANQPRPNTYVIKVTGAAAPLAWPSRQPYRPPRPQWKPRFTLVPPHRHLPQGGPAGPGPIAGHGTTDRIRYLVPTRTGRRPDGTGDHGSLVSTGPVHQPPVTRPLPTLPVFATSETLPGGLDMLAAAASSHHTIVDGRDSIAPAYTTRPLQSGRVPVPQGRKEGPRPRICGDV